MSQEIAVGYAQEKVEPVLLALRELLIMEINRIEVLPSDIGIHLWTLPESIRRALARDNGYLIPVLRLSAPLTRRIDTLRWPRLRLMAVLRVASPSGVTRSVLTGSVGYVATGLAQVETTIHSSWADGEISRKRYRAMPHSQRLNRTRDEMNRLKQRYGSALAVRLMTADKQPLGCLTLETPALRPLTQLELDRCVDAITLCREDLTNSVLEYVIPS
jgi:hypothetical protein